MTLINKKTLGLKTKKIQLNFLTLNLVNLVSPVQDRR